MTGGSKAAAAAPLRLGSYQALILAICFCIVLIDGFDTQAAAFAAPLLKFEIQGGPQALGLVFSAGLFGGLLGGIVFGPLGDRVGRKPVLLVSLALIAASSLATAAVHGVMLIAVMRLITGIGVGGAIPSVIALAAEYAPRGARSTTVAVVFSGFPLGAVVGSVASAALMPTFGWRSIFLAGGVAPAVLLFTVLLLAPESIRFLQGRAGGERRIARIRVRLGEAALAGLADEDLERPVAGRNPIFDLFAMGRAGGTVLLWLICFVSLLAVYCIVSWLPTLVRGAGLPLQVAVLAVGAINLGSVAGNVVIARLGDRMAPFGPMALAYGIGAVCVAMIGRATGSETAMLLACLAAGVFTVGAQMSVTALIAGFYPAHLRSTGVGWSFGVGRLGGVIGPAAAGALLGADLGFANLMVIVGGLSAAAAVSVLLLGWTRPAQAPAAQTAGA